MKRNAIIMAAGLSTRFVPLSVETPKALIEVKGEILIERQIRQLQTAGITEIVVVTGYKQTAFDYLADKFNVILKHNDFYQKLNNHSTLYVAKDYLKNTFICSADNYFTENVFLEETQESYYAAVFETGATDEWCIQTDDNQNIQSVTVGGHDTYVMKGHAFLNEAFTKRFIPLLDSAITNPDAKNYFWEDLYLQNHENFNLKMHPYTNEVIQEFDNLEELRAFDQSYLTDTRNQILKTIAQKANCHEDAIHNIKPIKENGFVIGFTYYINEKQFEYLFSEVVR